MIALANTSSVPPSRDKTALLLFKSARGAAPWEGIYSQRLHRRRCLSTRRRPVPKNGPHTHSNGPQPLAAPLAQSGQSTPAEAVRSAAMLLVPCALIGSHLSILWCPPCFAHAGACSSAAISAAEWFGIDSLAPPAGGCDISITAGVATIL